MNDRLEDSALILVSGLSFQREFVAGGRIEHGLRGEGCHATGRCVEEGAVDAASPNGCFLDSRVETQL